MHLHFPLYLTATFILFSTWSKYKNFKGLWNLNRLWNFNLFFKSITHTRESFSSVIWLEIFILSFAWLFVLEQFHVFYQLKPVFYVSWLKKPVLIYFFHVCYTSLNLLKVYFLVSCFSYLDLFNIFLSGT